MSSNTGFNPYENFNNPFMAKDPFISREAKHLTKLSLLAGAGLLAFALFRYVASLALAASGVLDESSFSLNAVVSILMTVLGVYVPFTIIHHFYTPQDKELCYNLDLPGSKRAFLLALGAGTMLCFLGNYITAGFTGFVSSFDIEFAALELDPPANVGQFLLFVLQASIIPALVEEVAIRGIVMPPLRKYGDRFAIVMSAIIFALMHGNMQQIPFAFVAGLVLGYFAISTGSVWTSIAIHAATNFVSVLATVSAETFAGPFLFYGLTVALIAAGIYCTRQYIKEPHESLGLTFAPKSERRFMLVSFMVFMFMSFVYSTYSGDRTAPYILTSVLLIFCVRRYLKANKRYLNPLPVSSLNLKTKVALYCSTPTVVTGIILLATTTLQSITVTSTRGYVFLYAALMLLLVWVLYMVYKILNSKIIENKSIYKKTIIVLIGVFVVSMISSFVSNLLMY